MASQQTNNPDAIVFRVAAVAASLLVGGAAIAFLGYRNEFFLTLDQQGQRLADRGELTAAAEHFADPLRRGLALYDAGEFKEAASAFAGLPGPDAAFNHANSLVMQGKYEDAVKRFDRALELRPDWTAAIENREIAAGRAERVKQTGGEEGTGGKLGADEIVFSDNPNKQGDTVEMQTGAAAVDDATMRSMWLREVQTTPGDFLRVKFAYQRAKGERASSEQVSSETGDEGTVAKDGAP